MTMNSGTHTVVAAGARPKRMNKMVSGIHEITVLSPPTSMVSSGKALPGELGLGQQGLVGQQRAPAGPQRRGEEAPAQDADER